MKSLLKTAGCVALFASMVSAPAMADDSGCGLGTLIIKSNTKLMQLFALTTNDTTFTNYFGITTGTSDCKASGLVMRDKEVQYFAEVNKDDLTREMAQGSGEKLSTLASLYGCKGAAADSFAKMTQTSYGKIVPSADVQATELVRNLNQELSTSPDLVQSCSAI